MCPVHMITVDISNVWGEITLPDLLALEKDVAAAHAALMDGTGDGSTFSPGEDCTRAQIVTFLFRCLDVE